jgi:RecA/RadA recombinase
MARSKKPTTRPGRPPKADMNELFEEITAKLGGYGVVLQRGSELEGRFDLRRPCGIPQLDIATGGGLPAGGLSQIDGPDGVGKNLLIYSYFAQAQRLYGDDTRIFMLCMEYPFDKMYARKIGFRVPFSNYEIEVEQRRRKENGEETLGRAEIEEMQDSTGCGEFHVLRGVAEANLDALVEMIGSNAYQLGAIDSWDAMLTITEDEKELVDNAKVADSSGIQTRWMKKVQGALMPRKRCPECFSLNLEFKKTSSGGYSYYCRGKDCGWKGPKPFLEENETTVIGIRQVRANLNMNKAMHAREWKVGGAYALKHGKLIDIQLRPGEILYAKGEGKGEKIGKEVNFEITKGKAGTHEGRTGSFKYYFDPPEVDIDSNFKGYCTAHGIIKRGGSVYSIEHGGLLEGQPDPLKFSGESELIDAIADSELGLKQLLWKLMLKEADLQHVRHKDVDE